MLLNKQFGEYILLRKIATGGMAEVHLALKRGPGAFNKLVALKSILRHRNDDENFLRMFENEAQIAARFHHPNLVDVYDLKAVDDCLTMVLEYVPGVTVEDVAKRLTHQGGDLPRPVALRLVMDACRGLHHAHNMKDLTGEQLQIVHRDVSPQNILVSYAGHVKVFDFGIARSAANDSGSDLAGVLAGKYAYMSPEQAHGGELDERSDVFSLGVILYELTTSRRLFKRNNQIEVLRAITEEDITPPSEVVDDYPRALERLVMSALERDPNQRPRTALEFANAIRRYAGVAEELIGVAELGSFVAEHFGDEVSELETFLKEAVPEAEKLPLIVQSTGDVPIQGPPGERNLDLELESLVSQSIQRVPEPPVPEASFEAEPPPGLDEALVRAKRLNIGLTLILVLAIAAIAVIATMWAPKEGRDSPTVDATQATLTIHSDPSGATIYLNDGLRAEVTPATIPLAGDAPARVQLELEGYQPASVDVEPGAPDTARQVVVGLTSSRSTAGRGVVYVVTDPRDAAVVVDGVRYGASTPITISDLSIGDEHTLRIEREGFETRTIQFQLSSTAPREMRLELIPLQEVGRITIVTEPPGAEVLFDGELAGLTPLERFPLLAGRDFELEVTLGTYQSHRQTVRLTPDGDEVIEHAMQRRRRANGTNGTNAVNTTDGAPEGSAQVENGQTDTEDPGETTGQEDETPYLLLPD